MDPTEVDRAVGRYLRRVVLRYLPGAGLLLAVLLVVTLVSPTRPTAGPGAGAGGSQAGVAGGAGPAGGSAGGSAGSSAGGLPGGAVPGTPAEGGAGSTAGGPASAGGGPAVPGASAGGVSRTGVTCGAGARQFTWSRYAPPCVAAFHGSNGGATGQGVTGSTITLTYRLANSAQQSALQALAGAAYPNDAALVADLRSYIDWFNTQFELYGRHVVLKTFNAQGDFIQEDQGQDLAAAQADSVTAHDLGAFGDVTFLLESSQPYEEDLAHEGVVGFSAVGEPHSWFVRNSPYEFSVQGPEGSVAIDEASAVVCRRLAGMPAVFSGNAADRARTRAFGVIYPENPEYTEEEGQFQRDVASQCGLHLAKVIAYSIDATQFETEATAAVAQLRAAGVTSIFCACDPVFPILFSQAAHQQNYLPEILTVSFGDPVTRDYDQTVWAHTLAGGFQFPPLRDTEPFRVFQLAHPGQHPAEWAPASPPYFYVPYYQLLQVFLGLQAAGPHLTAASFARGLASLPPSQPGDPVAGQWIFGNGVYDPVASFGLVWWDPRATSAFDGAQGAYRWCNGGATYLHSDLAALGGPHQQLACFGP